MASIASIARTTQSPAPSSPADDSRGGCGSFSGGPTALADAIVTHRQAESLLQALRAERDRFEARVSSSRPDPVSTRAGRGAIDAAIDRTKAILASLDRLLRLDAH